MSWFGGQSNFRQRLAEYLTYHGKRNVWTALGWKHDVLALDYRTRFRRNSVANRVVKALPNATWRGGAELVEDEDPESETAFEAAFADLDDRLKIWDVFRKADILAGLLHYSVIVIGAPGEMDTPLEKCSADQIQFLKAYAEDEATIQGWELDSKSPRFGQPTYYLLSRQGPQGFVSVPALNKRVHFSRCLHVTDGALEDNIFGEPRLECVWNDLDDLEKVKGGGAEAFWRRADQGTVWDLDAELDASPEEQLKFEADIQKYEHGLKRNLLTRGVTPKPLGSDVADFSAPVLSIIGLISVGTGIPQRVLLGSEQGKLAAKQDRGNWDDRVADRREAYAGPLVVRPFVKRLQALGALPETPEDFDVRWPELKILDDEQRANVATAWAALNKPGLPLVVHYDEIRERVLQLAPMADVAPELDGKVFGGKPDPNDPNDPNADPNAPPEKKKTPQPKAAASKGGAPAHVVADRFRPGLRTYRQRLLQRKQNLVERSWVDDGAPEPQPDRRPEPSGYGRQRVRAELEG